MARGVWGLDVSKSCLKAVRLELNDDRPEITDVDIIDYTPAASRDDAALEQEIRMALSLFTSRHNLKKDNIAASLPGHSTFNRFIKLPPTDPARLKDIVQYEAQQHIPFPINEVIWAYQMVERQYQPGEELEAVLFAVKKDLIDQFLATMSLAGVQIDIIQFAPVALYNFISYSGLVQKSGVILDMGANNTDLILIDDNKFWIRNLPIVGNDITHAIEKKFELPFAEAEKLKVSAAQSPQAGKIFTTIQPVLKDLVGEIHRSIGYYKSLSPMGKPPAFTKMVAMGNATRVIYFDEFVSQRLQMELIRLKKMDKFEVSPKLDPAILATQMPSLGVAIGLGLQYLGQTINRINLLPQEIIKIKQATKRKPFIAAIAAIATIIVLMMWWTSGKTLDALNEVSEKVDEQTKNWKEIDRKYKNVSNMVEFEDKLKRLIQTIPNREILELTIICGLICRRQSGVLDEMLSRDFVKAELGKRLADAFNIAVPPDAILLKGAVAELKIGDLEGMHDEEAPKESDKKYYRFKIVLDIPL
ncbi:MAG: type IV pilus assembly protein PilM [Planctomycetes bacterium]|nr:type IV pilus assembly protein PilM [Planctomycetota bacterium]